MHTYSFDKFTHHSFVGFIVIIGLINLALNMENNESRLISIPKKEFKRVLIDIMNGTTSSNTNKNNSNDNNSGFYSSSFESSDGKILKLSTPRSDLIQKQFQNDVAKNKFSKVKRDSFYFLQKGLMNREKYYKGETSVNDEISEEQVYKNNSKRRKKRNLKSKDEKNAADFA